MVNEYKQINVNLFIIIIDSITSLKIHFSVIIYFPAMKVLGKFFENY